jgi:hypothetical protein
MGTDIDLLKKKVCRDCGQEIDGTGEFCQSFDEARRPKRFDNLLFITTCTVLGFFAGAIGSAILDAVTLALLGFFGGFTSNAGMRVSLLSGRHHYYAKLLPLITLMMTIVLLGGDVRLGFLLGLIITSVSIRYEAKLDIFFLFLSLASTGIGMLVGGLITGNWTSGASIGGITGLVIMYFFWLEMMQVYVYHDILDPEWVQTLHKQPPNLIFFLSWFSPIPIIITGLVTGWIILATIVDFLIITGLLWYSFILLLMHEKKKK